MYNFGKVSAVQKLVALLDLLNRHCEFSKISFPPQNKNILSQFKNVLIFEPINYKQLKNRHQFKINLGQSISSGFDSLRWCTRVVATCISCLYNIDFTLKSIHSSQIFTKNTISINEWMLIYFLVGLPKSTGNEELSDLIVISWWYGNTQLPW